MSLNARQGVDLSDRLYKSSNFQYIISTIKAKITSLFDQHKRERVYDNKQGNRQGNDDRETGNSTIHFLDNSLNAQRNM